MQNDSALRSLQNRPGLVGRIINAIERLTKGKSMVEQSEYRRLANRLREIAGIGMAPEGQAASGDVVRYATDENDSIKQQIIRHQEELNKMSPVAAVTSDGYKGLTKQQQLKKIMDALSSTGFAVDRQGFGTIIFDKQRLHDGLNYAHTTAERAAFLALPNVLKRGVEISEHGVHKGRDYGTVTIAAPVTINGQLGNMGITIKKTKGNFYKAHRILMPDGTVFVLPEKVDAESTISGGVTENGSLATPINSASNNSIFDVDENSNTKFSGEDDGRNGVRYDFENTFTPEVLKQNINEVAAMEPVADIDMSGFEKGDVDLTTQVELFFNQIGNKSVNSQIGEVLLDRRGAKSDIAHGIGRKKAASFAAVPNVIEQGKIVDYQQNWKNRGYDSAVIAAPITIDGEPYIEGVVLRRSRGKNSFYLHEVLTEKSDGAPFKTGAGISDGLPGGTTSPIFNLLQKVADVKQNMLDENSNTKFSVEDELTGEGGADIIGSTQSAIETVRQMHREGKTPNEIYNATRKAIMANGDIYSGIGGTLEGNVNDDGETNERGYSRGADTGSRQRASETGTTKPDRRGNSAAGRKDFTGSDRNAWRDLSQGRRQTITDAVKHYTQNQNEEFSVLLKHYSNISELAEDIYSDYVKGNVVAEHRWKNFVTDIDGLLQMFDEVNGDNARYSLDELTGEDGSKSENKSFTYETLISKPDIVVPETTGEIPVQKNGTVDVKAVVSAAKTNAQKYGNPLNNETMTFVKVLDTGDNVLLTSKGLRHGILGTGENSKNTAAVEMVIGDYLTNAIRVNYTKNKDPEQYVLVGAVRQLDNNKSTLYIARSVIDVTEEGYSLSDIEVDAVMHSTRAKKVRDLATQGSISENSEFASEDRNISTISIARFLDIVKECYPDVLSENVLKRLGLSKEMLKDDGGSLKDSVRFSIDDPEFLQKLADMDEYYELLKKTASPTDSGAEEVIDSLVSTQYNRPKQPLTQKAKDSWYRVKQLMVDSGEAVGRIGKETGDKYLYAYYNMARASTNAGVSMVVDAQTDISGKRVGDSLNDIFEPIKAKGDEYYKQFELYMWHLHNVDRMSRESDSTKVR